jgi:hypothetical protein
VHRHSITVTENESWQGSGFLPDTIEEAEVYEDNEYFQVSV